VLLNKTFGNCLMVTTQLWGTGVPPLVVGRGQESTLLGELFNSSSHEMLIDFRRCSDITAMESIYSTYLCIAVLSRDLGNGPWLHSSPTIPLLFISSPLVLPCEIIWYFLPILAMSFNDLCLKYLFNALHSRHTKSIAAYSQLHVTYSYNCETDSTTEMNCHLQTASLFLNHS
jgi:hypothetical protein